MRIPPTTTTTREFGSCPACGESVMATIEFRVSDLRIDGAAGTANLEAVGISVSHDCRTKATDEPTAPTCDRDHADEWVEMDEATWLDLPSGARTRRDWVRHAYGVGRFFAHRDDLPDNHDDQKEN